MWRVHSSIRIKVFNIGVELSDLVNYDFKEGDWFSLRAVHCRQDINCQENFMVSIIMHGLHSILSLESFRMKETDIQYRNWKNQDAPCLLANLYHCYDERGNSSCCYFSDIYDGSFLRLDFYGASDLVRLELRPHCRALKWRCSKCGFSRTMS